MWLLEIYCEALVAKEYIRAAELYSALDCQLKDVADSIKLHMEE